MINLHTILKKFTLAKFISALFTIIFVASIKYAISGNFHIEYCEFINNVALGLLGWTINNGFIGLLSELFCIKGINFNLKQILFGFETLKDGGPCISKNKPKLYLSMESDEELNPKNKLDKGKGVDRKAHPFYTNTSPSRNTPGNIKPLDKDKTVVPSTEPPFWTWAKIFPGKDPASTFFPPKTNPGPGFNVPGGEVPINDEICSHIGYNANILSQFKKMDLETAVEQRNNNLTLIKALENRLAYAQNALSKIPLIPITEYEFKLKNQILRDLDSLNVNKTQAEARTTLLTSRIQFIESKIPKNI